MLDGDLIARWLAGLREELRFWEDVFATGGGLWPEVWRRSLKPRPIGSIVEFLPDPLYARVLDVGSGPVTTLGDKVGMVSMVLIPCDPLALPFARMADRHRVWRPVNTRFGLAETLTSDFGASGFDLVTCGNTLDRVLDPLRAVDELLAAARVGGRVMIGHALTPGGRAPQVADGRYLLRAGRKRVDLGERFAAFAELELKPAEGWVDVTFVKTAEGPALPPPDPELLRLAEELREGRLPG